MQQIWTNPSYERSFIHSGIVESELSEFLKLRITQDNKTKNIIVFPEMEYNFVFYDSIDGDIKQITGLVTKVYKDQIQVKYITANNYENIDNNLNPPMPTCGCILNPPDISKYNDPKVTFIPIANLVTVDYIINNTESD